MNLEKLFKAEAEAREFLSRAKRAREKAQNVSSFFFAGCRESGALRRQSLELSAALVELRKSR